MWREFPIVRSMFPISSISHPWLWWIQTSRSTSNSLKKDQALFTQGKSLHSLFVLSLCSREKTNLDVGGSLAGLHQSPLTVSFFLFKTDSHHHSPKYFNLLIFVHHQVYCKNFHSVSELLSCGLFRLNPPQVFYLETILFHWFS